VSRSSRPPQIPEGPDELLDDLEDLRDVLHDPDARDLNDVPLLDDEVAAAETATRLTDAAFRILMGDKWQDSAEGLLQTARQNFDVPVPDDDALAGVSSNRVKHIIDASVAAWLAQTLQANIGALREHLVRELTTEILRHQPSIAGMRKPDEEAS